jgi:hypothetical protein
LPERNKDPGARARLFTGWQPVGEYRVERHWDRNVTILWHGERIQGSTSACAN